MRENNELRENQVPTNQNTNLLSYSSAIPFNTELLAEMNERIDVLMSENSLLLEQKVLLSNELDKHQLELQKKCSEVASLSQQQSQLKNELTSAVQTVHRLEQERDVAASHALSSGESLGQAEIRVSSLEEQVEVLRRKDQSSEAALQDAKKQLKEWSQRVDDAGTSSMRQVKFCEERVRELHAQLLTVTQEAEVLRETNRKLKSEYQSTRQDAEGMLQVMTGLERQLNEFSNREAEVESRAKAAKDSMEESLAIRDQCSVREEQSRREIDRLQRERKAVALQRKEEVDKAVMKLQVSLSDQMSAVERELRQLSDANVQLLCNTSSFHL